MPSRAAMTSIAVSPKVLENMLQWNIGYRILIPLALLASAYLHVVLPAEVG